MYHCTDQCGKAQTSRQPATICCKYCTEKNDCTSSCNKNPADCNSSSLEVTPEVNNHVSNQPPGIFEPVPNNPKHLYHWYSKEIFSCINCGKHDHKINGKRIREYIWICEDCIDAKVYVCTGCHLYHGEARVIKFIHNYDAKALCFDCFSKYYTLCSNCHEITRMNNIYIFGTMHICRHCMDHNYVYCIECNELYLKSNNLLRMTHDGLKICQSCYNKRRICPDCGQRYKEDQFYSFHFSTGEKKEICTFCRGNLYKVKCYSHKPEPIFQGKNPFKKIGLEWEFDRFSDKTLASYELYNLSDNEKIHYLKEDGSLSNDGIEIVTHPGDMEFFRETFPIDDIVNVAKYYGGQSSEENIDGTHTGIHTHMNRRFFKNPDLASVKIIHLVEKEWRKFIKFSRRDSDSISNYCIKNRKPTLTRATVNDIKYNTTSRGRYQAVNLENNWTIELRIFAGTLDKTCLLACVELTDLLMTIAEKNSFEKIEQMNWNGIIDNARQYRYVNMLDYCEQQNLLQ